MQIGTNTAAQKASPLGGESCLFCVPPALETTLLLYLAQTK